MLTDVFFFNDTATPEISPLSLHDALPISLAEHLRERGSGGGRSVSGGARRDPQSPCRRVPRSEEHTSELQSRQYLVCRLLLEKKKPPNCTRIHFQYANVPSSP